MDTITIPGVPKPAPLAIVRKHTRDLARFRRMLPVIERIPDDMTDDECQALFWNLMQRGIDVRAIADTQREIVGIAGELGLLAQAEYDAIQAHMAGARPAA